MDNNNLFEENTPLTDDNKNENIIDEKFIDDSINYSDIQTNNKKKSAKFRLIITLIMLAIITGIICFFSLTKFGYFETIKFRGFDKYDSNIYIDGDFTNREDILEIISSAENRNNAFWSGISKEPTIIITNDEAVLKILECSDNQAITNTYVCFGVHNFVVINPDSANIDIVAHELSHAELHNRLFKGKMSMSVDVPTWFDEGIAMQVDYRTEYNNDAWIEITDNGKEQLNVKTLSTTQFYAGGKESYILANKEIKSWLKNNSIYNLYEMINSINDGEDFTTAYKNY